MSSLQPTFPRECNNGGNDSNMTEQEGEQPRRKRARIACTACNARRVKCNLTESQPCTNCIAGGLTCETRESKRGKHPRHPKTPSTAGGSSRQESSVGLDAMYVQYMQNRSISALRPTINSLPKSSTRSRNNDEVAASYVLASLSGFQQNSLEEEPMLPSPVLTQPYQESLPDTIVNNANVEDPNRQEDDTAVFLGESSALHFTEQVPPCIPSRPYRPRLRHSVPNAAKADALIPEWEFKRRLVRIRSLRADGAFSFPSEAVRVSLLRAYFRWFHPHFPVVNEPELWAAHHDGSMSPLLLQSVLFIGVIHAEDTTLNELGWGSRHRAKYQFYTRAKDIYDTEYETKKLTVIQSLFLMSFWRAGALLEKDVRHWLGAVISLAQTKALHRSAAETSGMEGEKMASLKRRIWWAIYVRERQASSALGLPNRIRDDDCDVEVLSEKDFRGAFDPSTSEAVVSRYVEYAIGMVQLSVFLGRIVDSAYLPNRTLQPSDRTMIRNELYKWESQLPSSIQLASLTGNQPSFQASMLHLAYNNLVILLYRSAFITPSSTAPSADPEEIEAANTALQAAARNSRIVEDILSTGQMCHVQIHGITNLFNTLCIHVAQLRKTKNVVHRTIAEHRAKLCLLGLQEIQRTWEVTNWVLQLFFGYLDRATAERLKLENGRDDGVTQSPSTTIPGQTWNSNIGVKLNQNQDASQPHAGERVSASTGSGDADIAMTPWSWTTEEANRYLFSQIENEFAFGEGGMFQWSPEDFSNVIPDLGFGNLDELET